ncbi:BgTH12-07599 [Blumeria graminis f. sp. triticale]|uniref:BgTH12-07599 n=1 Tax=Blumeria graminis f. sp. triticale TaxID=1689686 RepID=A0A9W4GCE6_BLUGR|nr:BgTH12-07599 [Blumeria graminis f. sp. triticale]
MFSSSASLPLSAGSERYSAKLDEVTKIIDVLEADIHKHTLDSLQRSTYLEKLKVYGRDPTHSDPIYTKQGISTLAHYAFNPLSDTDSQAALRCIANAMLLRPETRQIFLDLGLEETACDRLCKHSQETEFLISRILFLMTYDTNIDLEKLISQHDLARGICANLSRHSEKILKLQKVYSNDSTESMALSETLKLMFNITHFCPQKSTDFSPALKDLFEILINQPISVKNPMDPFVGPIINAIMNLPLEKNSTIIFPEGSPEISIDCCVRILERSLQAYEDQALEQNVPPLIILLRKINDCAPPTVQSHLQRLLLPSTEDREKILGRTDSLPSQLLRLSSNSVNPQIQESILTLLFELSGCDAKTFIHNLGYGYASGFLFKHKVPVPENCLQNPSIVTASSNDDLSSQVNPITGQLLEKEENVEIEEMTEEEKEREAEKLFVLFERLNKTGVISVNAPGIHSDSNRFEEVIDHK